MIRKCIIVYPAEDPSWPLYKRKPILTTQFKSQSSSFEVLMTDLDTVLPPQHISLILPMNRQPSCEEIKNGRKAAFGVIQEYDNGRTGSHDLHRPTTDSIKQQ